VTKIKKDKALGSVQKYNIYTSLLTVLNEAALIIKTKPSTASELTQ
jgi:hypothetical protein